MKLLFNLLRRLLTCFGIVVALAMLIIVGVKSYSAVAGVLPGASNIAVSPWQTVPREVASETLPLYPVTARDGSSTFDGHLAYEHVLAQVDIGPRPTGSEAGWSTGDFIISSLHNTGWQVQSQEFIFNEIKGRNIVGRLPGGRGPIILIGAHYDTRPAADRDPDTELHHKWIEGANDGASGVAVLLELTRALEAEKLENDVWLAFFDAEDRGNLDGWRFSVGAQAMADHLWAIPEAVIVVDMVGDADQQIYFDRNSDKKLSREIWDVAARHGYRRYFIAEAKYQIADDHLPFVELNIPAIDIIDFDYPHWHTTGDTADKVSPDSLERVGRTLEAWLEDMPPQILLEFHRSGGFAGLDDRLVVFTNGEGELTRFKTQTELIVDQETFGQIITQLNQVDFYNLQDQPPVQDCCDLIQYEIEYQGVTLKATDTAIPDALQPLFEMLDGIE